ncbi:ribokinase [Streptomyces sp. DH37]|uniref:ribokinase n=1 Tax=Streptomyces sp. DH37 TaxID=3040122 RepID=UPI002442BEF3|nr:ribokinase [Streptomyces sp. DH37]MDG9702094.1 ribokinase [Streptomyces sp. DH37]
MTRSGDGEGAPRTRAPSGHDLLVVGSANADLVTAVDRHPAPGETVLGSDLAVHPGGKGANQAVAAARLGARTALLARVGDDAYGRMLLDSLRGAGVDTAPVLVGGAPTGVALIAVDPSGGNTIVVSPGANARLTPADAVAARAVLAGAAVVSLQLEVPPQTVAAVVRAAVGTGTRVVLNPSPPAALPGDVLAACDPLVVNEHEARLLLAGEPVPEDPGTWAAALLERGPRSVVVTLGASGALLSGPGGTVRVPSPAVEAVDTTGAGDAFTGALAWRLARGDGLEEAVRLAVRVGAAAVTRPGAQAAFPTGDELPAPPGP